LYNRILLSEREKYCHAEQMVLYHQKNADIIAVNSQRLSKLEECMMNTKDKSSDLKIMIKGIDDKITRHMELKK